MSHEEVSIDWEETAEERVVRYVDGDRRVEIVQSRSGYGMLILRTPTEGEIERYYALDMAVDHAADLLGRDRLPVPDPATQLGI